MDPRPLLTEMRNISNLSLWAARWYWIPIMSTAVYLVLLFVGPKQMADKEPFSLRTISILWNAHLSILSGMGALVCVPPLLRALHSNGYWWTVCADVRDQVSEGGHSLWVYFFLISKLPEFGDTALLILKKRPVTFLHSYHHASVLCATWLAFATAVGYGTWFVAMNYSVHFVMYGYYAVTAMGGRWKKRVAPLAVFITAAQLSQMCVGLIVTASATVGWWQDGECTVTYPGLVAFWSIYATYFLLFLRFFYFKYVCSSPEAEGKKVC